jgi:hypothetical protein
MESITGFQQVSETLIWHKLFEDSNGFRRLDTCLRLQSAHTCFGLCKTHHTSTYEKKINTGALSINTEVKSHYINSLDRPIISTYIRTEQRAGLLVRWVKRYRLVGYHKESEGGICLILRVILVNVL